MKVKLIVSDLDGSLLNKDGTLPDDFDEVFGFMQDNNILFAAASGRPKAMMDTLFSQYADDMVYITDNGAQIYYKNELIYSNNINPDEVYPLLKRARDMDNIILVACTKDNVVYIDDYRSLSKEESDRINKFCKSWQYCDVMQLREEVIKYMLLYYGDIEKDVYHEMKQFANKSIQVMVSAPFCIDVFNREVSKGNSIDIIHEKLNIKPEETVVFGDYINDMSMGPRALLSFSPANAHEMVKQFFTDTIGPNTSGSVTKKIKSILGKRKG